ncbi:hypothetical protein R1A27_34430 (plasmid) [Methylobacterium sp. NMS12]|uniref:hypothetical protein n=1 Tax=Methylobacterium sp. NMS12 TaxID=3079766 RepID=UPI003F8806F8
MTGTIIPLRSGHSTTSALTHFDITAMELLREGRAATLSEARLDAIRTELLAKRAELAAVLADLQARPSSGDAEIDAVNITLSVEAGVGLAHIDQFIAQVDARAPWGRCSNYRRYAGQLMLAFNIGSTDR